MLCGLPRLAQADTGAVFGAALSKGPLVLGLSAFGAGLLVSLTPCVYPMVAITVSVFGAKQAGSRLSAFLLSGCFVLGLACMFTPLGVTAALTGKTFGSALSSPWVVVGLSALFLALAASMFGAFDIDLPSGLKTRLAGTGRTGYAGAFILGLVCGPIAAPCTGPFLAGLLAWIAQTQSVGLGSAVMLCFSLGLGAPFFLVGAFAMQLPKSGRWMNHVKSLMGIVLVVVALYFLGNSFPAMRAWVQRGPVFLGGMLTLVLLGIWLGAVHRSFEVPELGTRLRKALGILLMSAALFGGVTSFTLPEAGLAFMHPEPGQNLQQLVAQAREQAGREKRPLFLDFTAAWCAACKEIEKHSFPDASVQREAARFIAVKMDMTDDSDPAVEAAFKTFQIRGLPTLLLLDSQGAEAARFGDFVPAAELAAALARVK
jgi:thiol:disulfide interchange protein DsbD